MQTITELNKKLAYRSVKVIYLIVIVMFIAHAVSSFYESSTYYTSDYSRTRITCTDSNIESVDIDKARYNVSDSVKSLSVDQKEKIAKDICRDEYKGNAWVSSEFGDGSFLSKNLVFKASQGVMEEKINVRTFVGSCLILVLAVLALTEFLRRAVYYIFLGIYKPKH